MVPRVLDPKAFKAYDVRGLGPQQLNDAVALAIGSAFAQVVGAQAVVAGTATHASGILASGRKLTFRLTQPVADFVEDAASSLCVLPAGHPLEPGGVTPPVPSPAQLQTAFKALPFSRPRVHIQPEGNLTLVTLATYFEVTWPAAGFKPGEIDTTTLLGYQVRIRPTIQSYRYVFGDGTSLGPTTSSGGIYPDGDITHTYPTPGLYPTRIDITYSGEFSVNAGAWIPIPDTVTIAGAIQPLTVKTAHARLVAH